MSDSQTLKHHYNRIAGTSHERIAALSDGVFAIAMTLIVLEVKVPGHADIETEAQLWAALGDLWPRLVTYLMSFLTLGIFWVGQQTQLNQFQHSDRKLTWYQLWFLSVVAVMPFSTEFLAEFITFRLALGVYWLTIFLLGLTLYLSWRYAVAAKLVKDTVTAEIDKAVRRRIVRAQTLYAIAAATAAIHTHVSIALIVAIQLNYAIARGRWLQKLVG
jgi:uncharacterized membrane protein